MMDNSRVVLTGAFCEQPPLGLLRTLERAGCWIVDDDLLMGPRMINQPIIDPEGPVGDPIDALVDAFLNKTMAASFIYIDENE